jgi:hypothetical protein
MNLVLFFNTLTNSVVFDLGFASFSNIFNYLKIDGLLLLLFTTLTTMGIYSIKFFLFLKKIVQKALTAQKIQKEQSSSEKQNSDSYKPQRSFPVEDFIPSLNQDFKKNNNIQNNDNQSFIENKKDS